MTYKQVEISQNTFVRDNADDVAGNGVDDGQTMDLVFGQNLDRIEETVFRLQVNEWTIVLSENLSPGFDLVLFEFFNLGLEIERFPFIEG